MKQLFSGWTFSRVGGVDQVVIRNGDDIANLSQLDQKLWAVLAMPTRQPLLSETLDALDADRDGKVRVPDILREIETLKGRLASLDLLFERNDRLASGQLADEALREAFRMAAKDSAVDLAAVDGAIGDFASLPFNGDGVIVPASAGEDGKAATFITDLVAAGYAAQDSSGAGGVDAPCLDRFAGDLEAYRAWRGKAAAFADLFVSEDEGRDAAALFAGIAGPVDDYFRRCRVLAMAGGAEAGSELTSLIASMLSRALPEGTEELARLPAAMPDASCVLRLDGPLHPNYGKDIAAFFSLASKALASPASVAQPEWEGIAARMSAYRAWLSEKPASGIADLDARHALDDIASLRSLIEKDRAMADEAAALRELRRTLLLKRDFLRLLGNFVNLDDFYSRKDGIFRSGRLFLDGRELELCLDVNNAPAHATMAGLSSIYLIYCDLTDKAGGKKAIVAALTAGDADNIYMGKNGIFYDNDGKDWDAVITKLVVQPISIREAFFSPYRWLVKTLEEYAMKRAATAESANMNTMKGIAQTTAMAGKPEAKPEQVIPKKIDVGTVAAIGVALGSIGAMVTSVLGLFFGMGAWMPLGFIGVLILISGPSMILAYMKLRRRNIGPLLNAEGWAVNGRLKINVPFGATLSHLATLPLGSIRLIKDPFAEKKRPWPLYLLLAALAIAAAAYFLGWLNPLLGR